MEELNCTDEPCSIPTMSECSRNGDMIDPMQYIFDTDITGWDFYYESNFLNGKQNIKKSYVNGVSNGLSVQTILVEDVETLVLVFDKVDKDERFAGSHVGYLKVVVDGNEPSTILQYNILVKPNKAFEP